MASTRMVKDPDATLPYGFDWSAWLSTGDEITESWWAVDDGIDIVDESIESNVAVVLLRGGSPGQQYKATNTVVTLLERTDQRTLLIDVNPR